MTTIRLRPMKPRNPWVAAALRAKGGAHRRGPGAERQRSARALRGELAALAPARPSGRRPVD